MESTTTTKDAAMKISQPENITELQELYVRLSDECATYKRLATEAKRNDDHDAAADYCLIVIANQKQMKEINALFQ